MFPRNLGSTMLALVFGGIVLLQISGGDAHETYIVGRYKYLSHPDDPYMAALFLALGAKKEDLPRIEEGLKMSEMEIQQSGEKITVVWRTPPDIKTEKTFTNGMTIDEKHIYKPHSRTTITVWNNAIHYVRTAKEWDTPLFEDFICEEQGCRAIFTFGDHKVIGRWGRIGDSNWAPH